MERKEEIIQRAKEAEKETAFSDIVLEAKGVNSSYGIGFLEGCVWADQHPRKGFIACEWSDEDEEHVNSLLERLEGLCRKEFQRTRFAVSEDEDWLKSIKQKLKGE